MRRKDLTGKSFGRWKVLQLAYQGKNWQLFWKVKCRCGFIRVLPGGTLCQGSSKSCGCLKIGILKKELTTHGMTKSKEYRAWYSMKARCMNPNIKGYKNWGGRGIKICERWVGSFENFFLDMGKCPINTSLDRIDNGKGYNKKNCRWATKRQQERNRRNNHLIKYKNKYRTLVEVSELNKISQFVLRARLNLGWTLRKALRTPVEFRNKQ